MCIYFDFPKKTFDKVPHIRSLLKVEAHGICGNVLKWTGEWLNTSTSVGPDYPSTCAKGTKRSH